MLARNGVHERTDERMASNPINFSRSLCRRDGFFCGLSINSWHSVEHVACVNVSACAIWCESACVCALVVYTCHWQPVHTRPQWCRTHNQNPNNQNNHHRNVLTRCVRVCCVRDSTTFRLYSNSMLHLKICSIHLAIRQRHIHTANATVGCWLLLCHQIKHLIFV